MILLEHLEVHVVGDINSCFIYILTPVYGEVSYDGMLWISMWMRVYHNQNTNTYHFFPHFVHLFKET